eukprot:GHVL01036694.1.p1 GENE.GHVL01036694.1~~GHVL01036694.1.p1  ORF type:complete len:410 (-),score=86.53 GHVL01036694.1:600-1676(-)
MRKLTNISTKSLRIDETHECFANLKKYGVTVIKGALTPEEVESIRQRLFVNDQRAHVCGEALLRGDGNIYTVRPTHGRLHVLLRGTLFEKCIINFQRPWMPLVFSYLPTEDFSYDPNNIKKDIKTDIQKDIQTDIQNDIQNIQKDISREDILAKINIDEKRPFSIYRIIPTIPSWHKFVPEYMKPPKMKIHKNETVDQGYVGRRIMVSDLQLLISDVLSETQPFHMDNRKKGLSVVIPLCDMTKENGPIEILPATHKLAPANKGFLSGIVAGFSSFFRTFLEAGGTVSEPLNLGDVLIYDARVYHRGMNNATWRLQPTLVFRYDYEDTPPPSQSKWMSTIAFCTAKITSKYWQIHSKL